MKSHLEGLLRDALDRAVAAGELRLGRPPVFAIEVPSDTAFGDLASNVAMVLAREAGRPPRQLADIILRHLQDPQGWLAGTEVAGPGFINFRLAPAFWKMILGEALAAGEAYGRADIGGNRKVQIEFVSANPTGPLHVGHGRGAVLGDVTARLLEASGHDVEREYYINDFGRQMGLLGESTWARYQQACGRDVPLPEGGYPGEYLVDVAQRLRAEQGEALLTQPAEEAIAACRTFAGATLLDVIKQDLAHFRVRFDRFVSERGLHEAGAFQKALAELPAELLYRDDGALFYRTTHFGDEKDRAVVRGNGEPTYFGGDVAHFRETLARGFERLVNVLGADHHGYIARLRAIVAGFGKSPDMLDVLLVQLVNLTRGGEPVRMGKRAGEFVTLRDVVDEVGVDATRFFFLLRKADSTLDFDLELAKKQHTDNPVFYVQYAHARICSVLRQAEAAGIALDAAPSLDALGLPEVDAVRVVAGWPEVVEAAVRELEPHRIVFYCQELAATFHRYYNQHRIITEDAALTQTRLALVQCIRQVLQSALGLPASRRPSGCEGRHMAATGLRLWDRLILFLAWTVTCGLVYLLGFYVGKGIQAQRLDTEERAIRLPITQGPPPEGHRPKSDLMFYDKLASSADRPAVPTPDPAPPPKATTGTLPPRAATATTVPPPPAPTPTTTPAAPRPTTTVAPRAATPPSTTPPRTVATTPPPTTPSPAARPTERPAPAPEEQRASRVEPPPTSGKGTWSVQAAPTRSRADADALLRRLRSKGYDATIVEVPRDGATWYRIRVGRYATAGQATEAMQRLRDQEGVSHVFVASE